MTRRGSLAYYLAAWICGPTFSSLALWLANSAMGSPIVVPGPFGERFFSFCFVGLILGFFPALIFGFLLRILGRFAHLRLTWIWAVAGAALATALVNALGWVGMNAAQSGGGLQLAEMFTYGPALLRSAGWWMPAVPGAVTGIALARIEFAFGGEASAVENPSSEERLKETSRR